MSETALKPIVLCDLYVEPENLRVGGCALLVPANHPNHMPGHAVRNNADPVITSRIVALDIEQKRLETRNTIYQWS